MLICRWLEHLQHITVIGNCDNIISRASLVVDSTSGSAGDVDYSALMDDHGHVFLRTDDAAAAAAAAASGAVFCLFCTGNWLCVCFRREFVGHVVDGLQWLNFVSGLSMLATGVD